MTHGVESDPDLDASASAAAAWNRGPSCRIPSLATPRGRFVVLAPHRLLARYSGGLFVVRQSLSIVARDS